MVKAKKTIQEQVKAHVARNKELRTTISGYGVPLNQERMCDLNFISPTKDAAQKLAEAVRAGGYTVDISEPFQAGKERFDDWNVKARKMTSVDAITAPAFIEKMVRLAEERDSKFDGWGTALVEAQKAKKQ